MWILGSLRMDCITWPCFMKRWSMVCTVTGTSKMRFSALLSWTLMQYLLHAIWFLKCENDSWNFPELFQKPLLNKWWMCLFKCLQKQNYLLVLRLVCGSSRPNENLSFVSVEKDVKNTKAETLNVYVWSV